MAQLTNKNNRDAQGRYTSRDRAATTTSSTLPKDDNTPSSENHTRASSRLSGSYDVITPTSQPSTPLLARPTTLPLPLSPPSPQNTTETEEMATAETVKAFHGDKEDENPEDFLRSFFRRMGNNSEDTKKAQFPNYLQADSAADDWFMELGDAEKKTWNDIETAFRKRWPRKKQVKKTAEEYEEEIESQKLKTEDLAKKETVAGREVYSHIAWADRMGTIVKGAKLENSTTYVRQVRKELPDILKEKIGTGHADWTTFLQAVRDVDIDYIRDSMVTWNKEQADQKAMERRIQILETVSKSPTAPLRQQLSTVSISRQTPPAAATNNDNPFANASGGQGNLRFATNLATQQYTRPAQAYPNPRAPATAEQKAELRALLNILPHHPDTQAGRQAHQAQQTEWVRTYGFGTKVTEKTPYPLRPGTAPVNAGECFTCGQIGHLGSRTGENCQVLGFRPLHPNEQQWRAICTRVLKEPRRPVADVRFLAVDDYGTTWPEIQGNGEGPST
jgi:hypothetical protein